MLRLLLELLLALLLGLVLRLLLGWLPGLLQGLMYSLLYSLMYSLMHLLMYSLRQGERKKKDCRKPTCKSKVACKFSKILLFSFWDLARKMRLVKSFRLLGSNREKVHWASSCGLFIARKVISVPMSYIAFFEIMT